MKYIKEFKLFSVVNEKIIDFKSDNIDNFYATIKDRLESGERTVPFADVVSIGSENEIEVVTYNQFVDHLSETPNSGPVPPKPPHGMAFATVNEESMKPMIIVDIGLDRRSLEMIYHMLKHENIHIGQSSRRDQSKKLGMGSNDVMDRKKYYSNNNEIMAFSQSISDLIISFDRPKSLKEAIKMIGRNQLYSDIRNVVDNSTLKRYNKYIYLYLQKHFEENN